MNRHRFWVLSPVILAFSTLAWAQPTPGAQRFALVVGANDGGADRVRLLYADNDAFAFAQVMAEMGGVERSNTMVLLNPNLAELVDAFAEMDGRLREARGETERQEVFFYYSGHSDEQGLRLSDGLVAYRELRAAVDGLGADVQIGILDSCASGHFTRIKGGERRLPFLYDESSEVRGHAFLTSSSVDEVAQESDSIGASFFTHALVTGLRGAADASGDRRVTLNEAYQFAFDETLSRTVSSEGGAQHPAYDIGLVGRGDMVLTDLAAVSATLVVEESLQGRLFVRDEAGLLVAELFKPAGRRVELGLDPGLYEIVVETDAGVYLADVELVEDGATVLREEQLVAQSLEDTTERGSVLVVEEQGPEDDVMVVEDVVEIEEIVVVEEEYYRRIFLNAALVMPLETNSLGEDELILNNLGLSLLYGSSDRLEGLQLGMFGNLVTHDFEGAQLAGALNVTSRNGAGLQTSGFLNTIGGELDGVQLTGAVNIVTGRVRGVQFSGLTNIVSAPIIGVQASGGANWANELTGAQLAPLNMGREVTGTQIGLVNVSGGRVSGLQFGLVNYADEADASIGLIAATREGGFHPEIWVSDVMLPFGGLRTEARHTYAEVGVGGYTLGEDPVAMPGAAIGVKLLRRGTFGLDFDLGHYWVLFSGGTDSQSYAGISQVRLLARWQPAPGLTIFGGPTFNVYVAQGESINRERPGLISPTATYRPDENTEVSLWPGVSFGLSFF